MMANAKFLGNDTRLFKVVINTATEELEVDGGKEANQVFPVRGKWDADFKSYVRNLVNPSEPCYIFFRLDSTNASGMSSG